MVVHGIIDPKDAYDRIVPLLTEIKRGIEYNTLANRAQLLLNLNRSEIRKAQEALKPVLSSVRLFFMSNSKKYMAQLAFNELKQIVGSSYTENALSIYKELVLSLGSRDDTVIEDFIKDKSAYKNATQAIVPEIFEKDRVLPEFIEIYDLIGKRNDTIKMSLKKAHETTEKLKEEIITKSNRLVARSTVDALKMIPVDQIKQYISGLRINALRVAGFNTMADVYTSDVYTLETIPGISEDSAHLIIRVAERCAKEVQKAVKLRINADNRTYDSTELVKAVYLYRRNKAEIDEALRLIPNKNKEDTITNCIKVIMSLGAPINWIFLEINEKQIISKAYQYLKGYVEDSFLNAFLAHINSAVSPSVYAEDAWMDFTQFNIEYYQILEELLPGLFGNGDDEYGLPEDLAKQIREEDFFPEGLLCTLRRYQEWGVKYILHQEKVLLGDEMGLGKTVQAIAAMVSLKNTGATHFIVVCPASVLPNWYKEIKEKSKLQAFFVYGAIRQKAIEAWKRNGGVAVTNYETTEYFSLL